MAQKWVMWIWRLLATKKKGGFQEGTKHKKRFLGETFEGGKGYLRILF